ncbi:hypothetical protein BDZ89DRAFT_1075112, partial [Hymenopellis radicata]
MPGGGSGSSALCRARCCLCDSSRGYTTTTTGRRKTPDTGTRTTLDPTDVDEEIDNASTTTR